MGLDHDVEHAHQLTLGRRYQRDRQESLRQAVEILNTVIQRDPKHYDAHTERGLALNELGDHSGALASIDFVLGRVDEWALSDTGNHLLSALHSNKGYALMWVGKPKEAIAEFELCIKALSGSAGVKDRVGMEYQAVLNAQAHIATANRMLGERDAAKKQYAAVLKKLEKACIFGGTGYAEIIGVRAEHGLRAMGYAAGTKWTDLALKHKVACREFVDSLK